MIAHGKGRPPIYRDLILSLTPEMGYVDICPQANRTAPSGYRSRYGKEFDFRCVRVENGDGKPFMLQARRI